MRIRCVCIALLLCLLAVLAGAQSQPGKEVQLPSSKVLVLPAPGRPQRTNSFPTAVALSPDGKYLAILNNGYGTPGSSFQQSIALLELATNQLRDFPDPRLALHAKQSYFLGLAWSSDGTNLYASMASLTRSRRQEARRYGERNCRVPSAKWKLAGRTLREVASGATPSRAAIYLQSENGSPRHCKSLSRGVGRGEAASMAMRS